MNKLIYFPARGRGEVIRLALAEAGVEWQDDTFKYDDFPKMRSTGRLPFLAVPVWEEDGFRLAQSQAILNHIGRSHGLYGSNPREQALIDQAIGAVEDVRGEFRKVMTGDASKRPEIRSELEKTSLPRWFGLLEKLLASNQDGKGYLVGDKISIADLALYYVIELARDNDFGAALADTPRLNAFAERIASRPKIAAYLKSSRRFPLTPLPK
jgi:glutathione S-transferase